MPAEAQKLAISDAESVYGAIYRLAKKYGGYPANFKPQSQIIWNGELKSPSIGLYAMQGAVYLRRYISGSYTAQLPFRICYKIQQPTRSEKALEAQTMIEELAKWMEGTGVGFKDGKTELQTIQRLSPVYLFTQDDTTMTLAVNMQIQYYYKKG